MNNTKTSQCCPSDLEYDFASNASCHGLGNIYRGNNKPIRIFWAFATVACVLLCGRQTSDLIQQYLKYESGTQVQYSVSYTK